jgi:hypothetical protein
MLVVTVITLTARCCPIADMETDEAMIRRLVFDHVHR